MKIDLALDGVTPSARTERTLQAFDETCQQSQKLENLMHTNMRTVEKSLRSLANTIIKLSRVCTAYEQGLEATDCEETRKTIETQKGLTRNWALQVNDFAMRQHSDDELGLYANKTQARSIERIGTGQSLGTKKIQAPDSLGLLRDSLEQASNASERFATAFREFAKCDALFIQSREFRHTSDEDVSDLLKHRRNRLLKACKLRDSMASISASLS